MTSKDDFLYPLMLLGQQPPAPPPTKPAPANTDHTTAVLNEWNKSMPEAAHSGAALGAAQAQADQAAANPTSPATTPSPTQLDPLAVQLFYTQAIAPMLQHLASGLQDQNKQFTDMAAKNMEHFQMPEAYKAIFGQALPRMASDQNDVITALTGAAASGPALDELMSNVTAARAASLKDYYETLNQGAATSAFSSALGGLPGSTGTGTTQSTTPQLTPAQLQTILAQIQGTTSGA